MIEVAPNLYIGNQEDYELKVRFQADWFVIHACKEPYHRQALGYTGRAASKDHPEYLMAVRENRLILNLVDVDNVAYVSPLIIDTALNTISEQLASTKVLVHCNQGQSRSAVIGLLYLAKSGLLNSTSFDQAEQEYLKRYPAYAPAKGMRDYARINWVKYKN